MFLGFKLHEFIKSGFFGSGCCIFSRYKIEDVFYFKFTVSSPAFKIMHGDWYLGKLVGLAVVNYHNLKINVYVTHVRILETFYKFRDNLLLISHVLKKGTSKLFS